MRRLSLMAAKAAILLLIFVVTPVAVGVLGMLSVSSTVYAPSAGPFDAGDVPPPPAHDPGKPTAVVLMSHAGSEVTDVLAPYEVLARSRAFNVYAVAADPRPVPLGGGLDVVPQLTFAELDARLGASDPELIVVPAMQAVGSAEHEPIRDWLVAHAGEASLVLSVCNGSQVLADAGLLDGRQATANWAAIDTYIATYADVEWVRGLRYVEADDLISTAGITSGVNGTLRAVARFIGEPAAKDLAEAIGYPDPRIGDSPVIEVRRLEPADAAIVMLEAAYDWGRPTVGVALADGAGEIEIAGVMDVHGGDSYALETTTLAVDGGAFVRSAHGLVFAPRTALDEQADLDRLIVPGRAAAESPDPSFERRASDAGLTPEYLHRVAPGASPAFPFDAPLIDFAERTSRAAADLTAKALEYPTDHLQLGGPAWPWTVLAGPVVIGSLAVIVAVLIGRAVAAIGRSLVGAVRRARATRGPVAVAR
jgi:transcriptional regulator GlxA family with amidase domain